MARIPPSAGKRIQVASNALFAAAKELDGIAPTLATVYAAIAEGIDSSYFHRRGRHYLHFKLPAGCEVTVSNKEAMKELSGPATFSLTVEQSAES